MEDGWACSWGLELTPGLLTGGREEGEALTGFSAEIFTVYFKIIKI